MDQPFDDTTKSYYRRYFEQKGLHAVSQFEVFARSRAIDLVVECTETNSAKLKDTIFAHFRRLNAVEFKGYRDPLTAVDLNRIRMRAWGLGAIDDPEQDAEKPAPRATIQLTTQEIAEIPSRRTVTIVCVTRPMKVLDLLHDEFHIEPTAESGVYCNNSKEIPVWIIHPTELDLKPANYPLLPLARGAKLEQFIELCLQQGLADYLQLTLDIGMITDPDVIWRKILEVYGMELIVHEETWPYIDEFFRSVPEAMQKVPTFQEALAARERAGWQEGKRKGEREGKREGKREGEREGILLTQRRTLLRLLRHKFGTVPDEVVQLIEKTEDPDQLDRWLDQLFDAEELASIEFYATPDDTP